MIDMYHDCAIVLSTSFADLDAYNRAYQELDWHYVLESEQIATCDYCDVDYIVDEGLQEYDWEGLEIGFCSQICLEYQQIKRQEEADQLEYDACSFPSEYEIIDGQIYRKARTPEESEAIRYAWERASLNNIAKRNLYNDETKVYDSTH